MVNVVLSDQGAREMKVLVSHNLGKMAMITLGSQIITVSKLRSALGDSFQLTGFTRQQAQDFVNSVRSTTRQSKG